MIRCRVLCLVLSLVLVASASFAQDQASLSGTVVDPTGAFVPGAAVTLLRNGQQVAETTSGAGGEFTFPGLAPDRYQVRAALQGFDARTTEPVFVGPGSRAAVNIGLQVGPLQQQVVVTAAATEVLQSQTGAPVTVIDSATLEALNTLDVVEAIRLVPGSQIVQTGQRGGPASMFVRGGNSNFNKVLIDGVAANDIGGAFDFGPITTIGVDRIEVLRQSNSVLYGSDALSGVVNLTTRRGRTRIPELSYAIDGGNLGTFQNRLSFGGAVGRLDYFSQFGQFQTDNDVPNSDYRNRTYAGRFGVALGGHTDLSGTLRWLSTDRGNPNGILLYGMADDSRSETQQTYVVLAAQSQWTDTWQTTIRIGNVDQRLSFLNPSPSGEAFDPFGFGANYLGNTVTLTAADGRAVTGRAILDFGGGVYPSLFESRTTRRSVSGHTTYQAAPSVALSMGGRFEREAAHSDPDEPATATRDNGGVFLEGRGTLMNRTYITAGIGYERNAAFKSAVTPRVSVATYLRSPSSMGVFTDTKLMLNAGTGIKAPSVFQEQSSLFALVRSTPTGAAVDPIGPERSRSFDVGIEQGMAGGRARARVSYFDNDFSDLIEFVSQTVLPQVGVAAEVAAATGFGAYVNSQSFRARGVETSIDAAAGPYMRFGASYTYLDAKVTESFSGGALSPAINPAFPAIPIGAFSPLVGARPFLRPTHSGAMLVAFAQGPAQLAFSGYFSGARDNSTFLSDAFFGDSMLLPNEDLDPAYQKFDLSGSYQVLPRLRGYAAIENVLDKEYSAVIGFPSLPRTWRVGAAITLGGN